MLTFLDSMPPTQAPLGTNAFSLLFIRHCRDFTSGSLIFQQEYKLTQTLTLQKSNTLCKKRKRIIKNCDLCDKVASSSHMHVRHDTTRHDHDSDRLTRSHNVDADISVQCSVTASRPLSVAVRFVYIVMAICAGCCARPPSIQRLHCLLLHADRPQSQHPTAWDVCIRPGCID